MSEDMVRHPEVVCSQGAEGRPPLSIAILTYPCEVAAMLLEHLRGSGFTIDLIVLQRSGLSRRLRHVVRVLGPRRTIELVWRRLVEQIGGGTRREWRTNDFYASHTGKLVVVPGLNHPSCRAALTESRPDIAIIGCAGILRPEVFQVPRLGTLNVHPGLLPHYRGPSPVCWALSDGSDVGVTLHFLDSGIDTGPIVAQQRVQVLPGDTLADISHRASLVGFELLTEALTRLASGRSLTLVEQPREAGGYRRMAPVAVQRLVEKKLAKSAADARPGREQRG